MAKPDLNKYSKNAIINAECKLSTFCTYTYGTHAG